MKCYSLSSCSSVTASASIYKDGFRSLEESPGVLMANGNEQLATYSKYFYDIAYVKAMVKL